MTAQPEAPVVACALPGCDLPAAPVSRLPGASLYRHCSVDHAQIHAQATAAAAAEAGPTQLTEILDLPQPTSEPASGGPPAAGPDRQTCGYGPCDQPVLQPGGKRGWQPRFCSWAHVQAAKADRDGHPGVPAPAEDQPNEVDDQPAEAEAQGPDVPAIPEPEAEAELVPPPSDHPTTPTSTERRTFVDGVSVALEVAYALRRSATFRGLDDETAKAIVREALS